MVVSGSAFETVLKQLVLRRLLMLTTTTPVRFRGWLVDQGKPVELETVSEAFRQLQNEKLVEASGRGRPRHEIGYHKLTEAGEHEARSARSVSVKQLGAR